MDASPEESAGDQPEEKISEDRPQYGRRLIPTVIDEISVNDPDKVFALIPRTMKTKDGFRHVTYADLAEAINTAAHWLSGIVKEERGRYLAYLGPSDLRYAILAVAAIKAGWIMFFPSPRNSLEAHLHLLDAIDCGFFLWAENKSQTVLNIMNKRPMGDLMVPGLDTWLDDPIDSSFSYEKTFEEVKKDIFVVLHTSGSTGLPKPIGVTHGSLAVADALGEPPQSESRPNIFQKMKASGRVFNGFPLFHVAGLNWTLIFSVYCGIVSVMAPANRPLTADLADEMHQLQHVHSTCLPPSVIEDLVKMPEYLRRLTELNSIAYGGAPLAKAVGNIVVNGHAALYGILGSTETPHFEQYAMEKDDWQYVQFGPRSGVEFRLHANSNYEMVIVRDKELELFQGAFYNFPGVKEYPMKDLFRAHPQKSNLWLHCGRLDDIIVLSNGEKLNPITMELAIQASPLIRSALIIGQGKSQPALIIETVVSGMHFNNASYLKKIWPYIRAANRTCPAHGRVSKSLVAFTTEDKPLIRNGKGSVVRSQTELAFKAEIKTLYDTFEQALDGVEKTVIKRDVGEMQIILFELVAKSLGIPVGSQQDDDFFDIGMDSIQVIELNRRLNAVVDHRGHSIFAVDTSTIYQYPTTQKLIHQLIHGVDSDCDVRRKDPRIFTMQNTLKWITSSPPSTSRWIAADITEKVVILTGSSGNLGSYILQSLIACEEFESIYCFNRSEVPASHIGPHSSRVHFVKVDLVKKYFGMNGDLYQYLLGSATHIVHNAWQVDFNLKLESFSPQLEGVRNLVAFAARSSRRPHIFFISSVSSVQNPQRPAIDPVLEKVYEIFAMAQSLGYGESKHISERLLAKATKTSAVPCSIFRVAQIAGPLHAEKPWNASEWLPSLIASCKFMKSIPSSLGVMESIDWIPVDSLANIITELITGTEKTNYDMEAQTHVYHLVNPTPTTWRDLLPIIRAHLGPDIEPIPFRAWVDLLNETACSTTVVRDAMHNPAVKLLRFFVQAAYSKQKYPKLDTTIATACSSTLRELGPVTPEWMALWMHQWGYMLPGGTG